MTKKHFQAIASLFTWRAGHNYSPIDFDAGYNQAVSDIANDLADYFAIENERFDRTKFLTACGLGGKVTP